MSWKSVERKAELPANWKALRLEVLERDQYRCQWLEDGKRCNAEANNVDHIKRGNDHRKSNLQSLCPKHHGRKTSREGKEARYGLAPRRGKLFEPHPGMREA